jgi:hypothetical protein
LKQLKTVQNTINPLILHEIAHQQKYLLILLSSFLVIVFYSCESIEEDTEELRPEVEIVKPGSFEIFRIEESIVVDVEAFDESGIESIDLLLNGIVITHFTKEPFETVLPSSIIPNKYTLQAEACDVSGNIGYSPIVVFEVRQEVENALSGVVRNSLGEPLSNVNIGIRDVEKKSSYKSRSAVLKSTFLNHSDLEDPFSEYLDTTRTSYDGFFLIRGLEQKTYIVEAILGGYDDFQTTYNQAEGNSSIEIIMIMSELPQVSYVSGTDLNYEIEVKWTEINLGTVDGYNIYERHVLWYDCQGQEDREYFYPNYTSWRKVNRNLVRTNSYTFHTEEYNGKYGIRVLPVNRLGQESYVSDATYEFYLNLPDNYEIIVPDFGLSSQIGPYDIPTNSHEITLVMRFFYNSIKNFPSNWGVYISDDGANWIKTGNLGAGTGQPSGLLHKNDYGYHKTFSLNQFKGRSIYIKTSPESYSSMLTGEITNYIIEYNQDGTPF